MGCLAKSCNTPARTLKSGDKEVREENANESQRDSSSGKIEETGSDKD
ncbi:MAG: hypothetical protein Q7U36_01375 [bacterium]|nr:hypothetical protein [bacterium]